MFRSTLLKPTRQLRSVLKPPIYRLKATQASPITPPQPSKKLPQLSELSASPYRLAFRSLPYASLTQVLFPTTSLQFTHSNPLFSLRCFPSPKSRPSSLPPRPPSRRSLLPSPPPSLVSTTQPTDHDPFLTLTQLRARTASLKYRKKPYTMDLTIFCSKKKVHKSAVIRERCKRRLREAVRLVVTRGAHSGKTEGENHIELKEEDVRQLGPRKWLMPGYHYIANVTLEIYRAPLEQLVEEMSKALKTLRKKAENATLTQELNQIPIPPPDPELSDEELKRLEDFR
ncbi:uncharacterized protein JCM6883_002254 [Sporobolomyces salmoneus]|uniref:uncharacterized protein n=1 Tax=Sporobolomyces salmoneus TaxID=183962 RepID=UPI003170E9CF